MKILWYCFSVITAEPWIASLKTVNPDLEVCWYDRLPLPTDREILNIADRARPDLILYTGKAGGVGALDIPTPDTLKRLRRLAPSVHVGGDFSDPPWWPFLNLYRECFDLTVNFDGNDAWPKTGKDFTCLSPMEPTIFRHQRPLFERPVPFGFAGSFASPSRAAFIDRWREECGLVIHPRDERYGSYQAYADFLLDCRLIPNVPFSGSDNSRQVKGRVLEAGLARACLLDHVESAARDWFRPGVDYWEYADEHDAVVQARWLLAHPLKMQALADSLHKRVTEEHSPEVFWGKVFRAAGVSP